MEASGIFSIISGAASAVQSAANYSTARKNAKIMAKEQGIVAQNRAREIESIAATQRVSYLNSGLEMEGSPAAVIADTHRIGREDIDAINSSYKQQIKNFMTQSRASLMSGLLTSSAQIYKGYADMKGKE